MLQAIPRISPRYWVAAILLLSLVYLLTSTSTISAASSTITNTSLKFLPTRPQTVGLQSLPPVLQSSYPWIPRKIWQTAAASDLDTQNVQGNSWHKQNPYWRYELLSDEGAKTFINESFAVSRPDIFDLYYRIETPIIKVDLLRYLVLLHSGGLYADIDVECIKPIDEWLPKEMRQKAGLILGIEYDDTSERGSRFPDLFLSQYVIVSRPNHPVMEAVIRETMVQLNVLGDQDPAHKDSPRPGVISAGDANQVLEATGPWMFQHAVFGALAQTSSFRNISELHHLHEPTLYGDVVILPINGFGWGQAHSRSGEDDMGERLVQHRFRQSWRNHETWELSFDWKGQEQAQAVEHEGDKEEQNIDEEHRVEQYEEQAEDEKTSNDESDTLEVAEIPETLQDDIWDAKPSEAELRPEPETGTDLP